MTWTSFHSRGEILRDVIAVANQRRDGLLPMDVDGVADGEGTCLVIAFDGLANDSGAVFFDIATFGIGAGFGLRDA